MVKTRKVHRPGSSFPVWTEVYPERCPGCHERYEGGKMAIGWLACGCPATKGHGGGHRTVFCRRPGCTFELFIPSHLQQHGPQPA